MAADFQRLSSARSSIRISSTFDTIISHHLPFVNSKKAWSDYSALSELPLPGYGGGWALPKAMVWGPFGA